MKIRNHLLVGLILLSPLALQSCFDNDYDLSDIDTTVRLQTTDLVVPLNIDVLTLDQVLDIDDDSEIVKDTIITDDGRDSVIYAIKKEGTFDSDPINVKSFTAAKPTIKPTSTTLNLNKEITGLPIGITGSYSIKDVSPATFNSEAKNVDEAIHSVVRIGVNTTFSITLKFGNLSNEVLSNMEFRNIKLQFPAGLVGTYNGKEIAKDGTLDLSDEVLHPDTNGKVQIAIDVTAVNAEEGDITLDYDSHTLTFAGEINIVEGIVYINKVPANTLPETVQFDLQPEMDAIHVSSFTGELEYNVNKFKIAPIDLSSLPDFLNQSGTDIMLENPQIYLSVTNPMAKYGVYFQTGFELTAKREGKESQTYGLDNGTFQTPKSTNSEHQFLMAPGVPDHYYEGYENPEFVPFTGLRKVLTGLDGMPTSIEVEAVDPKMPTQRVENFLLDDELLPVDGSYAFYAPLQLAQGSKIKYVDTINEWNDEDVDALTIDSVKVNFDATTDLPYDIELSIVPITLNEKEIAGVECSKVMLYADKKNQPQPVELRIKGTIKHLDGIKIEARVISPETDETVIPDVLRPDMKLYVKNSKITLTGYYEREL